MKLERTGFHWLIFKLLSVYVGTPEPGVFDHIRVQQVAVNVSVISTKCSIDILCSDCTQSIWITELIRAGRRATHLSYAQWKTQPWWFHVRAQSCCVAMTTFHSGCSTCHSTSSCFTIYTHQQQKHIFAHSLWWMFGSQFFLWQDLKHPFALALLDTQTDTTIITCFVLFCFSFALPSN